jgi:hypothetical protein
MAKSYTPYLKILFLAVVGVLCCAESWSELVDFGEGNIDFLRKYLPFDKKASCPGYLV